MYKFRDFAKILLLMKFKLIVPTMSGATIILLIVAALSKERLKDYMIMRNKKG